MLTRLMQPVAPSRWIRASAWAALAFGIFQFLALPMVVARSAAGWHFYPETAAELGFTFGCAWLAFRRQPIGLLLLGMLGVWRLLLLAAFVVRILTGHTTSAEGPAAFLALTLSDIFAALWVVGAVSTIRAKRAADSSQRANA